MDDCEEGCKDCPGFVPEGVIKPSECQGGGKCPYDENHCHDMDFHHFDDFNDLNENWCIPVCSRYSKFDKRNKRKK